MVVDTRYPSESSCYKPCLVLGECAVFEFAAKYPSRGDDIFADRVAGLGPSLKQCNGICFDFSIHRSPPVVRVRCAKGFTSRLRIRG